MASPTFESGDGTNFLSGGLLPDWNADHSANRFNSSYIEHYLDVNGGTVYVRGNLSVENGMIHLPNRLYDQPYTFESDISVNNQLVINGNVLVNSPGTLHVTGDISINGVLSVGSYLDGSIPLSAIASSDSGGDSSFYTLGNVTTLTNDMVYTAPLKLEGDISTNAYYYSNFLSPPDAFKPSDKLATINLVGGGTTSGQKTWSACDASSTGEYMIAAVRGGNIWISSNYGATWRELSGASGNDYAQVTGATQEWHTVSISGNGSIMMAKHKPISTNWSIATPNLYRSNDYGKTWYIVNYNGITYKQMNDETGDIVFRMSNDGNYIYSLSGYLPGTYNYATNDPRYIFIYSHNGGVNWNEHANKFFHGIQLWASSSGKYIVKTSESYPTHSLVPTPSIVFSKDYGVTFNILTYGPESTTSQYQGAYIVDSGKLYWSIGPLRVYDVSNANITPYTSLKSAYNQSDASSNQLYPAFGSSVAINVFVTEDGKHIGYTTFDGAGGNRISNSLFSNNYGASFSPNMGLITNMSIFSNNVTYVVNPGIVITNPTFFVRNNTTYIMYQFANYLYIGVVEYLKMNQPSNTYISATTTLKLNQGISAIRFDNGTVMSSSNISSGSHKDNNVVFQDSSFNNITVTGAFTSTQLTDTSDYRIKKYVQDLNETHILDNLRPVQYYQTQLAKSQVGFLAHELQEYYPELVDGEKDGHQMQSVNYNGLLAVLIHEVQRLKQNIKQTKAVIAAKKAVA